jgi:hypothetical protein
VLGDSVLVTVVTVVTTCNSCVSYCANRWMVVQDLCVEERCSYASDDLFGEGKTLVLHAHSE